MPTVVALGGGAFVQPGNFDLIGNHGISIWLDCAFEEIRRRLSAERSHAPLARDPERFRQLFEERREGYSRADFRVDGSCDAGRGGEADPRAAAVEMKTEGQHARAILKAALAAADPTAAVEEALRRRRDLDRYERIFVVGAGKAGGTMARAAEKVLGKRIVAGLREREGRRSGKYAPHRTASRAAIRCPTNAGWQGRSESSDLCGEAGARRSGGVPAFGRRFRADAFARAARDAG